MTVKELIEKLEAFGPEAVVLVQDEEIGPHEPNTVAALPHDYWHDIESGAEIPAVLIWDSPFG